jgi:hypothetical protein
MASVINPDNGELKILGALAVANGLTLSGKLSIDNLSDIDLNTPTYGDGALNVLGGGYFGGHVYVGGTLVANGDVITLGNSGGSLTLNSNISSDILPASTSTYDIGSPTSEWNYAFFKNVVLDSAEEYVNTSISILQAVSYINSSTNNAVTMLNGQHNGQIKVLVAVETPISAVQVTPDNLLGFTSIIFDTEGQTITLMYTYAGWAVISNRGASLVI